MDEKTFEDFLFSLESRERVHKTVREAVNRANAAGLLPAYEPAFSKLKEFSAEQKNRARNFWSCGVRHESRKQIEIR